MSLKILCYLLVWVLIEQSRDHSHRWFFPIHVLILFFFSHVQAMVHAKSLSLILKVTKASMNCHRWGKFNFILFQNVSMWSVDDTWLKDYSVFIYLMPLSNEWIFRFLSVFSLALAGFIASFFSSFTLCPTELVKCKLQSMREVAVRTHIFLL